MIVVINDPKGLYYGALVSGPVFREIADHIYASDMEMFSHTKINQSAIKPTSPKAKLGYKRATNLVYASFGIPTKSAVKANTEDEDTNNGISYREVSKRRGIVPDVAGMGLKDALFVLGNSGLKPIIIGSGQVIAQSIMPGTQIMKGTKISIALQ